MTPRTLPLLLVALPLFTGCATYEYELVSPAQFATHIPRKSEVRVRIEPLEYGFVTFENHLIVRIFNPTNDPIQLLGTHSAAVDPNGESHPLRTQTIAPGTFIRLILPPPRPTVYDPGPQIGFGIGVFRAAGRPGYWDSYASGIYEEPRYYTVFDTADSSFWDWEGETTARLLLTFQRGPGTFHEEFTFARRRV
jgi:hypothetical protein